MEDNVKALATDVNGAAHALGLGRSLVVELILRGRIRSIKVGRRRIVPISALEEFIASELALQAETAVESGKGIRGSVPGSRGGGQKERPVGRSRRSGMATPPKGAVRP